jgi:hypothetical protein
MFNDVGLKIFRINAPTAKDPIEQHHDGENVAELNWDIRKKGLVNQQISTEKDEEQSHDGTHDEERVAQAAPVANTVVG